MMISQLWLNIAFIARRCGSTTTPLLSKTSATSSLWLPTAGMADGNVALWLAEHATGLSPPISFSGSCPRVQRHHGEDCLPFSPS